MTSTSPGAPASQQRLGCVLAGGQSTRMGRDKAGLLYRGRPFIEHALERLRAVGCEPVIAGSRPDLQPYAPVIPDLHPGCGPLSGIEGALTALGRRHDLPLPTGFDRALPSPPGTSSISASADDAVLFLAIDLPLLPTSLLALLLERAERTGALATVPVVGGEPQPLCAVYRQAVLPGISSAIARGDYKIMRVLRAITSAAQSDFFSVEAVLAAHPLELGPQDDPELGPELDLRDNLPHRWFTNVNTPQQLESLNSAP